MVDKYIKPSIIDGVRKFSTRPGGYEGKGGKKMIGIWDLTMIAMAFGLGVAYCVEKIIKRIKGGKHGRK